MQDCRDKMEDNPAVRDNYFNCLGNHSLKDAPQSMDQVIGNNRTMFNKNQPKLNKYIDSLIFVLHLDIL